MLALLDRDGVLNEDRPDFVKNPGELRLIPGAAEAVARLNRAGWLVAVCTNQSCVGRGIVGMDMLERIHHALRDGLAQAGARLDAIYVAPDAPDAATEMRKPRPGMLLRAMAEWRHSADRTVMIGDALRDLQAAAAAGVPRILVRSGKGAKTQAAGLPPHVLPVKIHNSLGEAVTALLEAPP
jgi:D-glycero-D-manno-heptose 1,7-bisphosphate phosphatase